jgi:hypothetical protein
VSKLVAAAVALVLFVRWLASATVTVNAGGFPVTVPVFLVIAMVAVSVAAAVVALAVYRTRAERATLAAWRSRPAVAR